MVATKIVTTTNQNLIAYYKDNDTLHDALVDFETFLQSNRLKPYVLIGRVYDHNNSFHFTFRTEEEEVRQKVLDFLNPTAEEQVSRYRVIVKGYEPRFYPTNDLNLALILCKSLQQETGVNVEVELYQHTPHKEEQWEVWKDKGGKTADQIRIQVINGEMAITNLIR